MITWALTHDHVCVRPLQLVCTISWCAGCTTTAAGMGWLRLVGSFKLQVSFTDYRLVYRALLQKSPVILRSLLVEATPYV